MVNNITIECGWFPAFEVALVFFLLFQVRALKQKIEEERGKDAYPATGQKLIYAGKIWLHNCHILPLCIFYISKVNPSLKVFN